jgi:hypothetical protein
MSNPRFTFTNDEVQLLFAVAATVDPDRFPDPEVKAAILKAKAAADAVPCTIVLPGMGGGRRRWGFG